MREKDEVVKNVLRVAVGEIDVLKGRGQDVNDEQIHKILRKLILSNEETIKARSVNSLILEQENIVLKEFLPQLLDKTEINAYLLDSLELIRSSKSDGQATGVAMGVLKKAKLAVDGKDVAEVVKNIREGC